MDPETITRSIRIATTADAVWDAFRDDDGLSGWLAATVDLDVSPGSAGRLVDHDGTTRRAVVTDVHDGRRLSLVWWDETEPDDPSAVEVSLEEGDGATTVTVTETRAPRGTGGLGGVEASIASSRVEDLADGAALGAWGLRLDRLAARVDGLARVGV